MAVVVTGIGMICALGKSGKEIYPNLLRGVSGAQKVTLFAPEAFASQVGCEVKGFDPVAAGLEPKLARKIDRSQQLALVAAKEAVGDAGLDAQALEWAGCVIGTGIGGIQSIETQHEILLQRGPRRLSPFTTTMSIANMATGYVSLVLGTKGPSNCTVTACAASAHALYQGALFIQEGRCAVCLAGGAEAAITPYCYGAFCAMRAMSTRNDDPEHSSRPFDRERDGFVMGEGAAVLVLEEEEHARKRGANIYARLVSAGLSSDAHHEAAPDPEGDGAYRAMREALRLGKRSPDSIDYINAHGTSTPLNDKTETKAIRRLFGPHAEELWVSSTKSMTGHCLGAAGSIEAGICCWTLKNGVVSPTINLEFPDPECDLDYVPGESRERKVTACLSNSFGFGGHNASLLFEAVE